MNAIRTFILCVAVIIAGCAVTVTSQDAAAASCTAYADSPYLDGIKQNVIIGGGWYCSGGYTSQAHIGIKVLTKDASSSNWSIIYTDSYWLYDTSGGSYYSSTPISGCTMWYQTQVTVDANLGYDLGTSSSYLSACSSPSLATPSPI